MGKKMRPLVAALGWVGGGVECRRPRRARPRLRLLFRCQRWPRIPGLGGKGRGGDRVREAPGGSSGARGVCHTVVTRVPATALVRRSLHSWIPGGERPEASRLARPSREKAVERLSWRPGASLGKGAAAFPRSRNPRRPRPGRRPVVGGLLSGAGAAACDAADTQPAGTREKLNPPFSLEEARDPQVSVWVVPYFWPSCESSAVGGGEKENLRVSTGHTATEAGTFEAFPISGS